MLSLLIPRLGDERKWAIVYNMRVSCLFVEITCFSSWTSRFLTMFSFKVLREVVMNLIIQVKGLPEFHLGDVRPSGLWYLPELKTCRS